jgi:hypothetical protein
VGTTASGGTFRRWVTKVVRQPRHPAADWRKKDTNLS